MAPLPPPPGFATAFMVRWCSSINCSYKEGDPSSQKYIPNRHTGIWHHFSDVGKAVAVLAKEVNNNVYVIFMREWAPFS